MARRLPRWHWVRLVMVHGPKVSSVRCVLFALSVRMDEAGEAFPSQATLASDTALSERTVRDAVLVARSEGWLAVVEHVRPGQAWRLSHYVACIPDRLDLARVDLGKSVDAEGIADIWLAQYGDIADRMHEAPIVRGLDRARARRPKGAAIASGRSKEQKPGTGPGKAWTCGRKAHEGADVDAEGADAIAGKVRTPSPTKFPSEVPIKVPKEEGPALTRQPTRVGTEIEKQDPEAQPTPTPAKPSGSATTTVAPEVLRGKRTELRKALASPSDGPSVPVNGSRERISKLITTLPHLSDNEIGKILSVDAAQVRVVRHAMERIA